MPAENPPVLLSVPSMVNSAIDCWDDCKVWGNNKNKYKSPHSAFNSRSITTHDPSVEEICLRVSCPCCKSSAKGFSMATVEVLPSRCRCFQCPYIPQAEQPQYVNQSGSPARPSSMRPNYRSRAWRPLPSISKFTDTTRLRRGNDESPHDLGQSGKVRYIGVDSMGCWQFAYLDEMASKGGWNQTRQQTRVRCFAAKRWARLSHIVLTSTDT
jgi:hypothetical protein